MGTVLVCITGPGVHNGNNLVCITVLEDWVVGLRRRPCGACARKMIMPFLSWIALRGASCTEKHLQAALSGSRGLGSERMMTQAVRGLRAIRCHREMLIFLLDSTMYT